MFTYFECFSNQVLEHQICLPLKTIPFSTGYPPSSSPGTAIIASYQVTVHGYIDHSGPSYSRIHSQQSIAY